MYKEQKIIFLDFDGVINNEQFYPLEVENIPIPRKPTIHLQWELVQLLNFFTQHQEVKIVISSTWRELYDLTDLQEFLNLTGLPDIHKVIDVTPGDLDRCTVQVPREFKDNWQQWEVGIGRDTKTLSHFTERGVEIEYWMDINKFKPNKHNYIIIDDSNDFLTHQVPNFVRTDPVEGLTMDDVRRGLEILDLPLTLSKNHV